MATAMPSVFSCKLKLIEPDKSLIEGNKFIKWTEATSPIGVNLKVDEKCFILYWRDVNSKTHEITQKSSKVFRRTESNKLDKGFTKSEFLDISLIRDVKTGRYANMPKDRNTREILTSGKSTAPINEKTITIYYGPDFVNIQSINFVSLAENANVIAEKWTEFLFQAAINQRTQNLSPYENLLKLRTVLIYGKSIFDERTLEYRLPVQTVVDAFLTNNKQVVESERQSILHALNHIGLPCGKSEMIDEKMLTVEKFFALYLRLISEQNDEIFKIIVKYKAVSTKKHWLLNAEKFEKFINEEQRDPSLNELLYPFCTTAKAAELINKFEIDETARKKKQLTIQGLIRYLMDFENEIVDPIKYELCDDMEQPMSHYFINSSHNTYLSGHQITGRSDAEMYRQVLLSGCRCIELDCHEDEATDEPIITHGRTLCTKILFKEAVLAIKECAFKTSPYPVLLSFENYCGKRMLEKMANYLIDILGEQLLREPLPDYPLEPGVTLPSPEQLKYKILCKFRKKLKTTQLNQKPHLVSYSESESNHRSLSSSSSVFSNMPLAYLSYSIDSHIQPKQSTSDNEKDKEESDKEDYFEDMITNSNRVVSHRPAIKIKLTDSTSLGFGGHSYSSKYENSFKSETIANTMDSLVNYLTPTTFESFETSQKRNRSYEMSSFVETSAFNIHKEKPTEFVNYNKRQFSRIYPKGTRISSDNFIPQMFWNVGCQQVALNFQTLDTGMQLNLGKFEYNNKSGYLLKPIVMRRADFNKPFDPFSENNIDGIVATTLTIRIISGIYLNGSRPENDKRIGTTVNVEMFGLPADSLRGQKAYRVKATQSSANSFFVVYNDTGFTFKQIIMPELAILSISVMDEQNKLIGRRCLPVVGLRPGYRYVCLKNESNQPINMCCLFVHLKTKDYVPEEYEEFANALQNPIDYVKSLDKKDELLRRLQDDEPAKSEEFEDELFYDSFKQNLNVLRKPELSENDIELNLTDSPTDSPRNVNLRLKQKSNQIQHQTDSLLDSIDLNNIDINDGDIMREINLNYSKISESFLHLSNKYSIRIEKIENETETKINEFEKMLLLELEKLANEFKSKPFIADSSKSSRIKQYAKKKILGPFVKGSYSPNSLSPASSSNNLDLDTSELNILLDACRQKYVRMMMTTYLMSFKEIYKLKVESIEPLFNKLESLIDETHQNRVKSLRSINEKEISHIRKSANEEIKMKKKGMAQNFFEKDTERMFEKIEKECVSVAASLTEKSNQHLIAKLNTLTKEIDDSLSKLFDRKNKKLSIFQSELILKINEKKEHLEKKFLIDTSYVISLDAVNLNFEGSNYDNDVKNMINFKTKTKTYL